MTRTRPRKRALRDDSHSSRPNDSAKIDSYRPQHPPQLSKRPKADSPPGRTAADDQKENSRYTMKTPAAKQPDSYTSNYIDLTIDDDDDDDAVYPSRRNLISNKSGQFSLPHRPAPGFLYPPPTAPSLKSATRPAQKLASVYQSHIEADAVEELGEEIRWLVADAAVARNETGARSAQQAQMLRQTWEMDLSKQSSTSEEIKGKKRGTANKNSNGKKQGSTKAVGKGKKQGSTNEESKGNKEGCVALSRPGPQSVMFTIPEALAALKHGPKSVPYDLPDGQRLSYPVTRSYHLGAMRYGVDGTLVEDPAHKNYIAFKPTSWHDFQPDLPHHSRYDN